MNSITITYFFLLAYLLDVSSQDGVSDQLLQYSRAHREHTMIRTRYGVPVGDIANSLTAGPNGPMVFEDLYFFDMMSHFDRERIPDRVVHARGSGAFGYFEVTHDITKYTKAKVFEKIGKRTKIAVRFSPDGQDKGEPETSRDPVGFAIKFYTEDGIWDLLGYNSPVFFVRDPMLFPMVMHAGNNNPVTNLGDNVMQWDFYTLRNETVHHIMYLYSDNGIPDGYRHMDGFGQHAFKMVNDKKEPVYVKFHFPTTIGKKYLTSDVAANLTAVDPDHNTRDLYNAISAGNYPVWNFHIQVMTFEQAEKFPWNPFDITKVWPESDYPMIMVGKFVLNENPSNYFADVEQMAFSPAHLVPGIEPSPDRMLHARLFSYSDTQRYRLGPNHLQLPVNCPLKIHNLKNYQRDGPQTFYDQGGAPNYYPNSFEGPVNDPSALMSKFFTSGDVQRYNTTVEDNFSQARMFWEALNEGQKSRLIDNILGDLTTTIPIIQERAVKMFSAVNPTFGRRLAEGLKSSS